MTSPLLLEQSTARPATWRQGVGAPAAGLGLPGDYYVDTAANAVYYKDVIAGWTLEFNAGGGGGGTSNYLATRGLPVPTQTLRVTRPNNTNAYAAGQVYGEAADARHSFTLPAIPAATRTAFYTGAVVMGVQGCSPSAAAVNLGIVLFTAQPATVLGDQAALNLSDADIALIPPINTGQVGGSGLVPFTSMANLGILGNLNNGAGAAGRRAGVNNFSLPLSLGTPGTTFYFYLIALGTYTPAAIETLDLFFWWSYGAALAS